MLWPQQSAAAVLRLVAVWHDALAVHFDRYLPVFERYAADSASRAAMRGSLADAFMERACRGRPAVH